MASHMILLCFINTAYVMKVGWKLGNIQSIIGASYSEFNTYFVLYISSMAMQNPAKVLSNPSALIVF